jgi:hypothetical protein
MAKQRLTELTIPESTKDGETLQEGIIQVSSMYYKPYIRYSYKYVITNKGIWTRSPKVLCISSKTVFMAYSDIKSFALGKWNKSDCCVFLPQKGKPGNRVFFDDFDGAVKILDRFLPREKL